MGLGEAGDLLKRFVEARRLRSGVRSVDTSMTPIDGGHKEDEYAHLCQLVKGVDEWTLKLLDVWWCDSKGAVWEPAALELRGKMMNLPMQQVPVRLTLSEAAEKLGVRLTFKQARALYREAVSVVTDNLVERIARDKGLHSVVASKA